MNKLTEIKLYQKQLNIQEEIINYCMGLLDDKEHILLFLNELENFIKELKYEEISKPQMTQKNQDNLPYGLRFENFHKK